MPQTIEVSDVLLLSPERVAGILAISVQHAESLMRSGEIDSAELVYGRSRLLRTNLRQLEEFVARLDID